MVKAIINGISIEMPEGSTILSAAQAADVSVPTLCTIKDVSDIGACRVCVVEVEGCERLVPACNTPLEEGMVIKTDTPRVLEARRVNVSLLLPPHKGEGAPCGRHRNFVVQSLAQGPNPLDVPY